MKSAASGIKCAKCEVAYAPRHDSRYFGRILSRNRGAPPGGVQSRDTGDIRDKGAGQVTTNVTPDALRAARHAPPRAR
jgi:hypothetical protein